MKITVASDLVEKAVDAIGRFCEKYGYQLTARDIAHITLALYRCEYSETVIVSSPSLKMVTLRPLKIDSSIIHIFIKGGYLDGDLTNELNNEIRRVTEGKWATVD